MEKVYEFTPQIKTNEIEFTTFSDGRGAIKILSSGEILPLDEKETFIFKILIETPKPISEIITGLHEVFNEWTFMGIYKFLYRIFLAGLIANEEEFKQAFDISEKKHKYLKIKRARFLSFIHTILHPFLFIFTYRIVAYDLIQLFMISLPFYFMNSKLIGNPFLAFNNYFYGALFVILVFFLLIWLMNMSVASAMKRMGRKPTYMKYKKEYILPIPILDIQETEMLDYHQRITALLSGYSIISLIWIVFFGLNYLYYRGTIVLPVGFVSIIPPIEIIIIGVIILELSPFWDSTFSRIVETKFKIKNVRDLISTYLEKRFFKHAASLDIHEDEKKAIFLTFYTFLWIYGTLMFISWLLITNLEHFVRDYFLWTGVLSKIVIIFDILFLFAIVIALIFGIIYGIIKGIKSPTYNTLFPVSHSGEEKIDNIDLAFDKSYFFYSFRDEKDTIKQHLTLVNFPPGAEIIKEGEIGEDFFSIVSGKVEVVKEMPDGTYKLLAVLSEGASFGEIALIKDIPRTASIYAITPVLALKMNKKDFLDLIEQNGILKEKILETIRFQQIISEISFFRDISPSMIQKLWNRFSIEELPQGTTIIKEGETGDKFYAIVEGEVVVLKEEKEVATLGPGKYFGEIALLKEIPRTATVVSKIPIKLISLKKQDFIEIIMHNITSYIKVEETAIERL